MRMYFAAGACLMVCLAVGRTAAVSGAADGKALYDAIRTNDLARLKTLVASAADANVHDEAGDTPLHYAASVGSLDAMKLLLDKGADVNGVNGFGATPLVWSSTDLAKVTLLLERGANVNAASKTGRTALFVAAMTDGAAPIVKLLASKGADVKARDAFGNTTLMSAAMGDDLETMRFLVGAGVDVNAAGATGMTPLIAAAYQADLEAVKLLLAKGANVNAKAQSPALFPGGDPKSGPVALSAMTPLLAAASKNSVDVVRTLLDAGADVNARDGRGMTALMLAVATTHQNPAVIRLLIERGADETVQSGAGETAADWARKLGVPHGLAALKLEALPAPAVSHEPGAPVDAKIAAERSVALLEGSSQKFFESSGCISCHHQIVTDMAVAEARGKGLRVDANAIGERLKMLTAGPPPQLLIERMDIGVPEIFGSILAGLAALEIPANPATDMLVANIAASQAADGSWHVINGLGERPPTEDSAISRVALCIRALKAYGPPGRAAEIDARIAKARRWLAAAKAVSSEDHNMQLLGLYWSGADASTLKPLASAILAQQQADGGWRQHPGVRTDAYATGQSLFVLAKTGGVPPADAAYQHGVKFLLSTQAANGSWRVTSRAPKFQAYFNSGFPYAGDQWISAWATGWAAMAIAQAVN
jgi:ankyrin repeat protein